MDKSEQYIKMCERAGEIQALARKLPIGHFPHSVYFYNNQFIQLNALAVGVWLPNQSQLQEMVFGKGNWLYGTGACGQAQYLIDFVNSPAEYWTMEQLWMAFVMREKYGKVWDSTKEDWIKI